MDAKARRELIVRRIAREFKSGDVVNLGIGMPTQVANHVPEGVTVLLQSENGFIGLTSAPAEPDLDLVNAGGQPAGIITGGCFFDSCTSFGIIRGGHVDYTVLGTLEVDQHGNIANWMVPGKMVPGMGGAMDLLTGARKVIVATDHVTKDGAPKLLERCRLPLTAVGAVDVVVTDMGYFEITPDGFLLKEIAPGVTIAEVKAATAGNLIITPEVKVMTA
ncbi:MAG TPA: 3-oxoacid CoA-transferase subunit B [Symbiobacteriaceae bacterium]|jgi:acetate CoA/acetoacetate CoA-transferase beta subunit|nr:3-oxoacid CoA-transferase subunit B [Symbiobacteriaceae bacterium]